MIRLPAEVDTKILGADNMVRMIDHRDKDSFSYAKECRRSWGHLEEVLTWCKSELIGDWRWQLVDMSTDVKPGRYIFYFDEEKDCLAFVLKWG